MDNSCRMIRALKNTSSLLDKKEILTKYSEHDEIKKILYMTYDPYLNSYISDPADYQNIDSHDTYSSIKESILEFENLFYSLHNREVTGTDAKNAVIKFLRKCSKEIQSVYLSVLTRDLRCGIGVKTINSVYKDLIPTFDVQLASQYDADYHYKNNIWYASPKLDGVRGVFSNGVFLSRKGRPFINLTHIEDELRSLSEKISADLIDGEIYIPGKNFSDIYSLIAGDYPEARKKDLKFYAFLALNSQTSSTIEMLRKLDEIKDITPKYIIPVPYVKISNLRESIIEQTKEYVLQGFEGSVLRHPTIFHSNKRDRNLVKYKFFNETDVVITGIVEGEGKYTGMAGSLMYTGKIGNVIISGEVGSGLSDNDRQILINQPSKIIGKTMTVKFQELTPISENTASLRFPVILGMKADR